MDGNNQIYLITIDMRKNEDHQTCSWFLTKLKDYIGKVAQLAIISNQHHIIYFAMVEVSLDVHHGYCCHRLFCNMQSKYKRKSKYMCLYWKIAKTHTQADFEVMIRCTLK